MCFTETAMLAAVQLALAANNAIKWFKFWRFKRMTATQSISQICLAAAIVLAPTAAVSKPYAAGKLSIVSRTAVGTTVRAASSQKNKSELGGSILIAVLAAAAVVAGVALTSDGSNDSVSP